MPTLPPPPPRVVLRPTTSGRLTHDSEPFFVRLVQMPFNPRLWSAAAGWKTTAVIWPLLVLVLLAGGTLALYRSFDVRSQMRKWANAYDAGYPAVIIENGEARVEGGGVIREDFDGNTLLVDPEETVRLEDIKTSEYIVVRKKEIIRYRLFRTERTSLADLEPFLGKGPTRIDGAGIRAFEARWGFVVQLGLLALMGIFMLIGQFGGALLYSLVAGSLALALRGRALQLDLAACYRVALAASSLTVVVHVALNWLGTGPGACLGVLIWPTALTGLTLWAVSRG